MLFFQKEFGHKEQIIKDWEGENSMNDLAIKMQLSERISKSLLSKKIGKKLHKTASIFLKCKDKY